MSRLSQTLGLSFFVAVIVASACGGRSPIGSIAWGPTSGGATTSAEGGAAGAGGAVSSGGSGATGGSGTAGHGPGGSGGTGGYGPIDCMTCIGAECPEMLDCLLDPMCLQGLGCSVINCLGGGGEPDLECVSECFGGDMGAAMQALMGMMCIMETCGAECAGLLPEPPQPPQSPDRRLPQ